MTDANNPIYPCNLGPVYTDQNGYTSFQQQFSGLTTREYFAAMALQGLINLGFKADGNADPKFTAIDAVKYADALIAELNKDQE